MQTGVLLSLVTEDRIADVVRGIEAAVLKSFQSDQAPGRIVLVNGGPRITRDEVRRRSALTLDIFKVLRGDMKWSVERIIDALPGLLRKKLDGVSWEPTARAMWTPDANIG